MAVWYWWLSRHIEQPNRMENQEKVPTNVQLILTKVQKQFNSSENGTYFNKCAGVLGHPWAKKKKKRRRRRRLT